MLRLRSYLFIVAAILGTMFLFYTLAFYNVIDAQGRAFVIFTDLSLIAAALVALAAVSGIPARFDKGAPPRRFWSLVELALALAGLAGVYQAELTMARGHHALFGLGTGREKSVGAPNS